MTHTSVRRRAGAVFAPVLVAPLVATLAVPAAATAQPPAPEAAGSAVSWLATQLTDGVVHNDAWDSDDLGLTADIALSMDQVGTEPGLVRQIRQAMGRELTHYITGAEAGASTERYSGAMAKSLVLAQVSGADPRAYGGFDLVAGTEGLVVGSGPSAGRLADSSEWGDYANTFGQVLAARGLTDAGSPQAPAVTDFLLQQQCDAGYFRVFFTADQAAPAQGCVDGDAQSPADTDATAAALIHLGAMRAKSPAVRAAITKGAAWLVRTQKADGSFGGGPSTPEANANSTGLAAGALGSVGSCVAAGRAAEWVSGLQLSPASGAGLAGEAGAIAYDRAALQQAVSAGGLGESRDQWRRTTAQAVGGLVHRLGSSTGVRLTVPRTATAGKQVLVAAGGLTAGDRFCLTGPGVEGERQLVVASDGELRARVTLPRGTRKAAYTVVGRDGSAAAAVQVFDRARLPIKAPKVVRRGKKAKVVVKGLVAGERVVLRLSGRKVAAGRANAAGRLVKRVKVQAAPGRRKIVAVGHLASRRGRVTVKVR